VRPAVATSCANIAMITDYCDASTPVRCWLLYDSFMCRQSSQAVISGVDGPTRWSIAKSGCAWLQACNPYKGAEACLMNTANRLGNNSNQIHESYKAQTFESSIAQHALSQLVVSSSILSSQGQPTRVATSQTCVTHEHYDVLRHLQTRVKKFFQRGNIVVRA